MKEKQYVPLRVSIDNTLGRMTARSRVQCVDVDYACYRIWGPSGSCGYPIYVITHGVGIPGVLVWIIYPHWFGIGASSTGIWYFLRTHLGSLALCVEILALYRGAVCKAKLGDIKMANSIYSSSPGQNGCHFTDNIFICIFTDEKFCILIRISLKFVPKGPTDNNAELVQIIAWHRIGDKPIS